MILETALEVLPAAPTIEGARQLVDAAAAKGVVGQVGHMMRHADPIRIAADFAAADDFVVNGGTLKRQSHWDFGGTGHVRQLLRLDSRWHDWLKCSAER